MKHAVQEPAASSHSWNEPRTKAAQLNAMQDNRGTATEMQRLDALMNGSPRAVAQRKLNDVVNGGSAEPGAVRQFALPGSYEPSNANEYNPQGKSDTYRSGVTNFERLATSGFTNGWRDIVFDTWRNKGWVWNTVYGTMVREQKNQQWVNAGGIQLDHATTVSTMKNDLLKVNEAQAIDAAYGDTTMKSYYHIEDQDKDHVTWPSSKTLAKKKLADAKKKNLAVTVEPTIHSARKYYHDKDNLVPLLGTDNASKGNSDTEIIETDDDVLEVEKEWLEMLNWGLAGVRDKEIDEVQGAVDAMTETLDEYDGMWPVA